MNSPAAWPRRWSVPIAAAVLSVGCASTPELTRRYAEIRPDAGAAHMSADVSVFSLPVPSPGSRSMFDLGPGAQTAFINAARDRTSSMRDFVEAVGTRIPASPTGPGIDAMRLQRRVVFSLSPQGLGPADRIDRLLLTLTVTSPTHGAAPAWRFVSWDRFATRYETIELGDISLSRKGELGVSLGGLPVGSAGAEAGASAKLSRNLGEELELRQRYVAITGTLSDHSASLYQEGVVGIDLTGNSSVDVELAAVAEAPAVQMARVSGLRPGSSGGVQLTSARVTWPATDDRCSAVDIRARLEVSYRIRRVLQGAATIVEGDDIIAYTETTADLGEFVLVPARDQRVTLWEIVRGRDLLTLDRAPLLFASATEALEVAAWLGRTGTASLGGAPLLLGEAGLQGADFAVRPHAVNWGCDGSDAAGAEVMTAPGDPQR